MKYNRGNWGKISRSDHGSDHSEVNLFYLKAVIFVLAEILISSGENLNHLVDLRLDVS